MTTDLTQDFADDGVSEPLDHIEVVVSGRYVAQEIPPRARKPRPVEHETQTTATVPVVTQQQAPIALRITRGAGYEDASVLRGWNGRLFEPHLPWAHQKDITVAGDDRFPLEVERARFSIVADPSSAEDFAREVQAEYDQFLIVENGAGVREVWKQAEEPLYMVMTFGLGNNHGGTELVVVDYIDSSFDATLYFRADQHEIARARAIEAALRRGDTKSAQQLRTATPQIEIFDPAYVQHRVAPHEPTAFREARAAYRAAVDRYHRHLADKPTIDEEEHLFVAMCEARSALRDLTDDVPGERLRL